VFDVWKTGRLFHYVVSVCSEAEGKGCPIFPGIATRLSWPFPDPSKATGTHEERLQQVRTIRDNIRAKVQEWCEEIRG
jgi:arsenate reductase